MIKRCKYNFISLHIRSYREKIISIVAFSILALTLGALSTVLFLFFFFFFFFLSFFLLFLRIN